MEIAIRKGTVQDGDDVLALYDAGRAFMRAHGNLAQWPAGYPSQDDVRSDIEHGILMVCEDMRTRETVGTFAMQTWPEHTYMQIFEGAWPDQMPYGTVHRVAVSRHGHGIGRQIMRWAQERFGTLRCDTHADNLPMQALLEKSGFARCGIVHMDDGSPRVAYHWKRG